MEMLLRISIGTAFLNLGFYTESQGWGGTGEGVIIRSHNAYKTEAAQPTLEMRADLFHPVSLWLDIPLTTILLGYI